MRKIAYLERIQHWEKYNAGIFKSDDFFFVSVSLFQCSMNDIFGSSRCLDAKYLFEAAIVYFQCNYSIQSPWQPKNMP